VFNISQVNIVTALEEDLDLEEERGKLTQIREQNFGLLSTRALSTISVKSN